MGKNSNLTNRKQESRIKNQESGVRIKKSSRKGSQRFSRKERKEKYTLRTQRGESFNYEVRLSAEGGHVRA